MQQISVDGHEVIEKEAAVQGNSAHVIVPKSWRGATVKAVRVSEPQCYVCTRTEDPVSEWVWVDDHGGVGFTICQDCIYHLGDYDGDHCAICQEDSSIQKSEGFGPVGGRWNLTGCDDCRAAITGHHDGSSRIAWEPGPIQ